jgi:hypothetical protein
MSYYSDRRKAYTDINNQLRNSRGRPVPVLQLIDLVNNRYGFGKKIVLDKLKLYEKMGKITFETEDLVLWVG